MLNNGCKFPEKKYHQYFHEKSGEISWIILKKKFVMPFLLQFLD